ncbi:MAG TPA: hypothetical protein VD788_03440 [Candidatus Polarisedimenticolaceae bacterium]|nr:hypothetical protein [Candidatus Polarisedimenticolaceae bacterium]
MPTSDTNSTQPREREVTLEGVLIARRWKAAGQVAAYALNTLDEREYLIDDPRFDGRVLFEHLRKRVRVTGTVIGNRVVRVASIGNSD